MRFQSVLLSSTFLLFLKGWEMCVSAGSNAASVAWLAENSKEEDVITLPSGLQYKVLRSGDGQSHPTADSSCECHYKGTLIDGTQFDSSYDRGSPTSFAPNQVIKGWTEAMQMMVEGDKWEMYIPSELGYGDGGSPPKIKGGDALIFTMEIIKIKGNKVPAVKCDVLSLDHCNEKEKKYVESVNYKFGGDADTLEVEIERINKVAAQNPKSSEKNRDWGVRRVQILNQFLSTARTEDEL